MNSDLTRTSDAELVELLAQDGGDAAIAESYRRWWHVAFAAAAVRLRTQPQVAEELASSVLERFLFQRRFERLKDRNAVRQYLRSCAEFAALDFLRRQAKEAELIAENVPPEALVIEETTPPARELLSGRLRGLDFAHVEILSLRFVDELTLGEIARRLGITYAAAAQRISRAIRAAKTIAKP